MKYLLSPLFLLLIVIQCKAQRVNLFLNLVKGNTYYMVGTSQSRILQIVNGQENNIGVSLSYKMAFKVTGVTDSVYDMEVHYQIMDMKVKVANRTIEMNSQSTDRQDIPSSIIRAIMNKPFNIVMTKKGKIRSVKNVEQMIMGVFNNFPQVDVAKKEQIKNQLMQTFGESAIKSNLELETAIFPETLAAKSDKWSVKTKLEGMVKANVHTVYHLTDTRDSYYHIHGDGTTFTDKNLKPGLINGMPVKYDITGTSVADIKVDKITGWISQANLKQTMKGDVEILSNPKVPGGAKIPMTFNTEVTIVNK